MHHAAGHCLAFGKKNGKIISKSDMWGLVHQHLTVIYSFMAISCVEQYNPVGLQFVWDMGSIQNNCQKGFHPNFSLNYTFQS